MVEDGAREWYWSMRFCMLKEHTLSVGKGQIVVCQLSRISRIFWSRAKVLKGFWIKCRPASST